MGRDLGIWALGVVGFDLRIKGPAISGGHDRPKGSECVIFRERRGFSEATPKPYTVQHFPKLPWVMQLGLECQGGCKDPHGFSWL